MSIVLPHTRAWLALVSGQVPQLAQHLQPLTDFAGDNTRVQAAANAAMPSAGKCNKLPLLLTYQMQGFHADIACRCLKNTCPVPSVVHTEPVHGCDLAESLC